MVIVLPFTYLGLAYVAFLHSLMFNTSVGKQFCISIWDCTYEEASYG
jgi:hypothetical protein